MKKMILSAMAAVSVFFSAHAAKVDTLVIETQYLATPESVVVITPDAAAVNPAKKFPSVYLLNGYGGDHKAWLAIRPDLPQLADRYGMVIVMPDGRDSWYWDAPMTDTMQMESFIVKDLVPYVDREYPTERVAEKRAISGLSMGGHGALWLALNHPDVWKNAGSMSGGVDIRPFPERWKMSRWIGEKDSYPERWNEYTVAGNVDKLKAAGLNITFDCGADDFFAGVNDALHQTMLNEGIAHDYTSRPGAHSQKYWRNSILYHLLFFNEIFSE